MIDITALIPTVIARLKVLPPGCYVDLRPYKRNRSVMITRIGNDEFHVLEDGFFKDEFTADLAKLRKSLKALVKKEFPRSNKVRLYSGCR